jgi:bacillithiol biosynthesis cysteine-adding enzyme BshC
LLTISFLPLPPVQEMPVSSIPYAQTGFFSKLVVDYIAAKESLKPFYFSPPDPEAFKKAIEEVTRQNIDRKLLVSVLKEQYSGLTGAPEIVLNNIASLENKDTFTVTTGHQLCLCTGPLYFIYKIISTINLSEALNMHFPQFHFVPVYWMAGEDHDFDEISRIHLYGKAIAWEQDQQGKAGAIKTASLEKTLDELDLLLGDSENAKELSALFRKAYLGHNNLASATRWLLNELFGKYGLVILDPDRRELKKCFTKVIEEDIFRSLHQGLVEKTITELESAGYKAQVNPRAINFFYLSENSRERIEKNQDGKYHVLNTRYEFSELELRNEVKAYPERFSPNVVLRPLYQQFVLPNLAYIGGGAEIAYWLEYRKVFSYHNTFYPLLVLRNSVLWMGASLSGKWHAMGFTAEDLFKSPDELSTEFVLRASSETNAGIAREREQILLQFDAVIKKALEADTTLKQAAEAERQKVLKSLDQLEEKIIRAGKRSHESSLSQIKKIKEKLFPGGELQERHDNFIPFYIQHGKFFFETLKSSLNPFLQEFIVVS